MKISVLKNYITQIKCINSWENTKNKTHRNKQKIYEKQSKSKLTSHKEENPQIFAMNIVYQELKELMLGISPKNLD